jgi:YbbR domain-containing protein
MSDRNGVVGLRVISVAIALILWVYVTADHRSEFGSEKVMDASVTYNPPPGLILLNPIQTVRVRLRGSEQAIRHVNPFLVDVQVILDSAGGEGTVEVQLAPDNVLVPEGIEVVSIEPTRLELQLDREQRRLLSVRVRLTGEPAAGAVAGTPRVRPEQVLVIGPSRLVSAIDHLDTNPINLNGHALDFEESTLVASPDSLVKLQTQVVSVFIPMRQPAVPESGGR